MDNQQPSINFQIFYQKPKIGYGFIYKYTGPEGKSYIGQTIGSLKMRAKNVYSGTGYKKCALFWKAIEKYGWNNFSVEILEEVDIEKLDEKEMYYISKYNTLAPNGYNITLGGEGGRECPVYVYSAQNGHFIERYNSLTLASIETEVPIETISTILNDNGRKMAHNLVFSKEFYSVYDLTKLIPDNYCSVYVYDSEGKFYREYPSTMNASNSLGISYSTLRRHMADKTIWNNKYYFRKDKYQKIEIQTKKNNKNVPVLQIDPKTGEIINSFPTMIAGAKAVGLTSSVGILKVLKRGKGTSGGYFWKIDEGSTTKCL